MIFEKALDEPKYSSMYAQLCKRLSEEAPNFDTPPHPCTFRILLLNKCRAEFENRSKANEAFDNVKGTLSSDDEERKLLAKRKMLGNIKFIGELGKLEILAENILHQCIQQLLPRKSNITDMAEDIECLCQIMRTCGRILDHDKGHGLMQQYFDRMSMFVNEIALPQRIRFMIQDVIDLRQDNWVPRKAIVSEGPLPIHELMEEDLVRPGNSSGQNNGHNRNVGNGFLHSTNDMFRRSLKVRDDIIGPPFPNFTNGFGSGSYSRNGNRLNPLHGPVQLPSNNPSNHAPRMTHYQNHISYNSVVQNGNNQFSADNSGGTYGNSNENNSSSNSGNGGSGEHVSLQNNINSGEVSMNMGGKDIVPRYKRMLQQGTNLDDVSLRPSANSMVCKPPNLKQSGSQNSIRNKAKNTTGCIRIALPTKPAAPAKETPSIIIKSAANEKSKNNKKDKGFSKDEIIKKTLTVVDNLLNSANLDAAMTEWREIKIPDRLVTDVLVHTLTHVFSQKNAKKEHELIFQFIVMLKNESSINNTHVVDCFRNLITKMSQNMSSIPLIFSHIAAFAAHVICENILPLSEVADATENGKHYPLMLITLQNINKNLGKNTLIDLFGKSKINLLHTLPEADRTKERLAEILEDRNLTFLFPLLRIQADLWKQLKADGDPNNLYKWIKENLDPGHFSDPGFISALATVVVKYITQETTFPENTDPASIPDKVVVEKEKQMLKKFSQLLQTFLHNQVYLQIVAVYAIQVYWYSLNFPKGMLLRWFVCLYEFEIIEDEAFLKWREDVNDAYPGKGKALFQVNNWLQWLAEPDSDEEEDEEEEDEKMIDI